MGLFREKASGEDDPIVCFCHTVRRSRLLEAIRSGAVTLEAVRHETLASTNCGGCELDVREILAEELALAAGRG